MASHTPQSTLSPQEEQEVLDQQWELLGYRSRIKTHISELEDALVQTDHIIAQYYPEIDLSH